MEQRACSGIWKDVPATLIFGRKDDPVLENAWLSFP